MPEKITKGRSRFVGRLPELSNRKWGGMPGKAATELVDDLLKAGRPAIEELLDGLQAVDNGADWQERLLLHQLATRCSEPEREKERAMLTTVMVEGALSERAATVRSFLLQQLRLFADDSSAERLAPLLKSGEQLVLDAVTAAMVSIGGGAQDVLQRAEKDAKGPAGVAIKHALKQLRRESA